MDEALYRLVAAKYGGGGPPKTKTVMDHLWLTPPFFDKIQSTFMVPLHKWCLIMASGASP